MIYDCNDFREEIWLQGWRTRRLDIYKGIYTRQDST